MVWELQQAIAYLPANRILVLGTSSTVFSEAVRSQITREGVHLLTSPVNRLMLMTFFDGISSLIKESKAEARPIPAMERQQQILKSISA